MLGGGGGGRGWGGGGQAENVGLEQLDGLLDVGDAGGAEALVGRGDEVLDGGFVVLEPGVDVGLVDDARALGLGEDEVEEEEQADVGVKGNPVVVVVVSARWATRGGGGWCRVTAYHTSSHSVHDSTRSAQARTTQYMSHGVSWAGSEVLRAL